MTKGPAIERRRAFFRAAVARYVSIGSTSPLRRSPSRRDYTTATRKEFADGGLLVALNEEPTMAALLIVDDDAAIRDTLYDLFSEDHLCHLAGDSERALSLLREQHYDVVLTDISMPGLSGLELLGVLRQSQPHTPVIVVSGIDDQSHAEGLIRLGAFDYILKPFRLEAVERSVTRALEHRRAAAGKGSLGTD
jgi:CheY-like chemotaxis protein